MQKPTVKGLTLFHLLQCLLTLLSNIITGKCWINLSPPEFSLFYLNRTSGRFRIQTSYVFFQHLLFVIGSNMSKKVLWISTVLTLPPVPQSPSSCSPSRRCFQSFWKKKSVSLIYIFIQYIWSSVPIRSQLLKPLQTTHSKRNKSSFTRVTPHATRLTHHMDWTRQEISSSWVHVLGGSDWTVCDNQGSWGQHRTLAA